MDNLLVITHQEHARLADLSGLQDDYAWWTELREILGEHIAAQMAEASAPAVRLSWQLIVTTSSTVPEADRVIRGATLIYYDAGQRWALLGDAAGQLHLLDVLAEPAGAAPQLVDDPRQPVRLLRQPPPRPASWIEDPAQDVFTYDQLELKPWRLRHTILWTAFDQVARVWYRGRRVERIAQEPYGAS
jgi:hypothetical protein